MSWNKSICQHCDKVSECEDIISHSISQGIENNKLEVKIDNKVNCKYLSDLANAINKYVRDSVLDEIMKGKRLEFARENYDMFLPIKIVYESDIKFEEDNEGNLKVSRPMRLFEIAELFDVSVEDVMEGKIGMWTLEDEK